MNNRRFEQETQRRRAEMLRHLAGRVGRISTKRRKLLIAGGASRAWMALLADPRKGAHA